MYLYTCITCCEFCILPHRLQCMAVWFRLASWVALWPIPWASDKQMNVYNGMGWKLLSMTSLCSIFRGILQWSWDYSGCSCQSNILTGNLQFTWVCLEMRSTPNGDFNWEHVVTWTIMNQSVGQWLSNTWSMAIWDTAAMAPKYGRYGRNAET